MEKNKIKSNKQTKFVSTLEGSMKEKDTVQNHWKKYLENFLNFTLNTHTHTHTHTHVHIPDPGNRIIAKREIKGEKDGKKQKVVSDVPTQNTGTKGCTFTHRFYRKKLWTKNITRSSYCPRLKAIEQHFQVWICLANMTYPHLLKILLTHILPVGSNQN